MHDFLDHEQLRKSANATSICDYLAMGTMQGATTGLLPSESSFNGGSLVDDDMVVKIKEVVPGNTTQPSGCCP